MRVLLRTGLAEFPGVAVSTRARVASHAVLARAPVLAGVANTVVYVCMENGENVE